MRNNKEANLGLSPAFAVLCNGMLFKSLAPLNTLLNGCDPKKKPPSLYPSRYNPNGPASVMGWGTENTLTVIFS